MINDATAVSPLLLAIDIGNTHTVFGLYDGESLLADWRITSPIARTMDECWLIVRFLSSDRGIEQVRIHRVGIASVVPNLTDIYIQMSRKYLTVEPLVIGGSLDTGIKVLYDDPSAVGADRICDAAAAYKKYGGPIIIIDFGTATTFDVVTARGEYLGGAIAPGIETAAADLHRRAAKLPRIDLHFPKSVIGQDTISSMQAGIMFSAVDSMEGIVRRIWEELGVERTPVVVTGGLAGLISARSRLITAVEPSLVLEGVRIIVERELRQEAGS
jgi:type III pantothenate kinase